MQIEIREKPDATPDEWARWWIVLASGKTLVGKEVETVNFRDPVTEEFVPPDLIMRLRPVYEATTILRPNGDLQKIWVPPFFYASILQLDIPKLSAIFVPVASLSPSDRVDVQTNIALAERARERLRAASIGLDVADRKAHQ